jgi:predicted nuclease of predicted toxin-antitoxin system
MRVLLDECLPERLKDELPGHVVLTVREAGLSGKKNGLLMELASTQFDVLVTIDRGLPSHRNPTSNKLGVILVHARSNSFASLLALLPRIRQAVAALCSASAERLFCAARIFSRRTSRASRFPTVS